MLRPNHKPAWWERFFASPAPARVYRVTTRRCPECAGAYEPARHRYCPQCHVAVPEWRYG